MTTPKGLEPEDRQRRRIDADAWYLITRVPIKYWDHCITMSYSKTLLTLYDVVVVVSAGIRNDITSVIAGILNPLSILLNLLYQILGIALCEKWMINGM